MFDSSAKPLADVNSIPSLPVWPTQINVIIGERPPVHVDFHKLKLEWDFYDASYMGGSRYIRDGKDCSGNPVLVQHPCESTSGYEGRRALTAYHNYPRAVTDRLTALIFSRPVKRDSNETFAKWLMNVDGRGTPVQVFMHDRMTKAATLGVWGLVIDSNLIDTPTSKASENEIADIFLRDIDPRSCINWTPDRRAVLLKNGNQIQLVDDVNVTTWMLDQEGRVQGTGIVVPHGWNTNPIVWMHGCQDTEGPESSLIGDVACHSMTLANYCSWLTEELQKATFSQFILAAPNLDNSKLANVELGSRNWLVIPLAATDVKWECVGSNPDQAASLRESVKAEVEAIYRSVGLQPPDAQKMGQAESGVALQIRLSEMSSNASRLANNAEQCENTLIRLWTGATGVTVEDTSYPDPDDMDTGSIQDELNQALSIISADVPNTLKAAQVDGYVNKKFSKLDKKVKDELIEEVNKFYDDASVEERKQKEFDQQKELKGKPDSGFEK